VRTDAVYIKPSCYLWTLSQGFIKRDPSRFEPFLDGTYLDVASFCAAEVEPMRKECEQIQIIALTEYLGVSVDIAYLDGR
jgi:ubiquitin thioesterase protein OTUB1